MARITAFSVFFPLLILWISDTYLNSPWILHQEEMERYEQYRNTQEELHSDFFILNGSGRKHISFGSAAIHTLLTSNPDRRNKPPGGRIDRRAVIVLCLLTAGDVELNPGPRPQAKLLQQQQQQLSDQVELDTTVKQHASLLHFGSGQDAVDNSSVNRESSQCGAVIQNELQRRNMDPDQPTPGVDHQRSESPVPSCVSMNSDWSMDKDIDFKDGHHSTDQRVDHQRSESPVPSCVSMKSDWSMDKDINFKDGHHSPDQRDQQNISQCSSGQSAQEYQTELDSIFKLLEDELVTLVKKEMKRFQKVLTTDYPECLESQGEGGEGEEERRSITEGALKITLYLLRSMKLEELADLLMMKTLAPESQQQLRSYLKKKCQNVSEWISKEGTQTLLKQIFTELYITEGGSGDVNEEHEVIHLEAASRKAARPETPVSCEDMYNPLPGQDGPIKTVLTKGVAGIGKTVLSQKYTLEWAEDKANRKVHFLFPLTFRELNLMKEKKYSLVELLQYFFGGIMKPLICSLNEFKVMFILDGLDELRIPLDFHNTEIVTDVTKPTSVDVLLANLIRGNLLPSARIWITTRPAAANQIPAHYVDRVTEVRGFTDPQKEEYFVKRFGDVKQARPIISHVKQSKSLYIMCHIPVFCWITATVLEHLLKTDVKGALPKYLTEMYLHFLLVMFRQKSVKYHDGDQTHSDKTPESTKVILALGKLAFEQLEKGNLIFYEADLRECGIDVRDASVYSGMFTQMFKQERGLHNDTVFCFVHLSVQEFLAALHIFVSFIQDGINLLSEQQTPSNWPTVFKPKPKLDHLYQSAVDKALRSPNGHLDLFLRFLLGLSLDTNQKLLQRLLIQTGNTFQTNHKPIKYIKEKIRENPSPDRSINLFHCLNELNDHSLEEDIQQYLTSGRLSTDKLSHAQWSALVFMLLSSEKELDVFNLKTYSSSEGALSRLLPVLKASNKALLSGCNLSDRCCQELSSALSSSSSLREVDLSNNPLQDSGFNLLALGLGSPHCMLENLKLSGCNLSDRCCQELSSALSSSSSLKEIDLSNNDLQDSGVRLLAVGLGNPHCMLETLNLSGCLVTEKGCSSLTSALRSNPSHLRELNLTFNHPGESGEAMLSAVVTDPCYRLDILRVDHGGACWLTPGLRKSMINVCELTLDPTTAHRYLSLSENNKEVMYVGVDQKYPHDPNRFENYPQVMCREPLSGRWYCEVQCSGGAGVAVTHPDISRQCDHSVFGWNNKSWRLTCNADDKIYTVWHNDKSTEPPISPSLYSNRVAVYVDHAAGTVSFYTVISDTLTHLHTFQSTFTQPLYVGFGCYGSDSSVCL